MFYGERILHKILHCEGFSRSLYMYIYNRITLISPLRVAYFKCDSA